MRKVALAVSLLIALSGCVHAISKEVRRRANPEISFKKLKQDPERYRGSTVVLAGVVVDTRITDDGTFLEIYQTRMNAAGEPVRLDQSEGRFLAFTGRFLDAQIYRRGRKVTVAGVVKGERVMRLGERNYPYPYLVVDEIHLWSEEKPYRYNPFYWPRPYPWWRYPYHGPHPMYW